jgi:phosphatidylglycerophosphate synthase
VLDARLRALVDPPLDVVGRGLARLGVDANAVTLAGFALGVAAWLALAVRLYDWALVLILGNRLLDGLDGAVARRSGVTDLGGYLDIVCDFLFYAGVVFFFAVGRPDQALAAAFLIFSFVGTGSSFLAYAVFAAKRGMTTTLRGHKSLYYLGGLTEGAETIALFVVLCLKPDWFWWLGPSFAALCLMTTAARVVAARRAFG